MSAALDLPSSRNLSLAPALAGVLLLVARLLFVDRGAGSIPALAIIYLIILAISSSELRDGLGGRVVLPLVIGVLAIAGARFMLAAPSATRATVAGLALTLLAAIAEEALFRGLMFARLLPHGRYLAIAASAGAFALVHVPFYGLSALPVDLGAGLLFAWQRSESGSWSVPAATHALANVLAVLP
ncbi:MAG: Type prenyl endopeptidase Rce1-like [Actinomycetota bacterium]|jgi:membrane protease YdiL (CAAX protease family)|nr:Type prenyl endopeptidase Rce1-like [Actinomycetota bacterium]